VSEPTKPPLAGVRVIDASRMLSGPLATCILADQGADVIKIEPPGSGDLLRHMGYSRGAISAIFATVNRNKRSLAVDLRQPRGRRLVDLLVASADVFVQNFRPGVMRDVGLGAERLCARHPELVYASISGFGRSGPYADHPAYDVVIQALSGMSGLQAVAPGGAPVLVQTVVCDKVAALHAAQAICAALFARERGSGGRHLELSLLGATLAFLWPDGMQEQTFVGDGIQAPSTGIRDVAQIHPTRDGFVAVMAVSDEQFQGLVRVLGSESLERDARFATLAGRLEHARELADAMRGVLVGLSTSEACARLREHAVPAAPALQPDAVLSDAHVVEARLLTEFEHPHAGPMRTPRAAVDFGVGDRLEPAPMLGQHTADVLTEIGIARSELDALLRDGIVALADAR